MRTLKKFQQITEIVSNQFINSAPQKELQRALKSNLYWEHNQVKLNAKKEVLQKELIRINEILSVKAAAKSVLNSTHNKIKNKEKDLKKAIAFYLKLKPSDIKAIITTPEYDYEVHLKDGKTWEVTSEELTEINSEKQQKQDKRKPLNIAPKAKENSQEAIKVVKRTVRKSPQDKLDWLKQVAAMVESTSIKIAAHDLGKSVTYITRTYRAYTEAYLANTKIQNAFDNKVISWTQLHKLAEKKITSDRLEEFANQI